jgi:PAS domain-containing protein
MAFNPILQDGKTTGISVFGKDISERKRMQDALRKSEGKFSAAFLCSPAIMALTDLEDGPSVPRSVRRLPARHLV